MLGIIIGIGVFAILFPNVFDFIMSILSGIWNIIGNIVMFFVGLIRKINFAAIGDGLGSSLEATDKVISPVLDILPDSPIVPVVLLITLGILWLALDRDNLRTIIANINIYSKLTFAWCATAMNLGLVIAGSGHTHRALSAVIDDFFTDYPMTLQNFVEWNDFAKTMLIFTILGGGFTLILFTRIGGIRSFIRTIVGYSFCGMLGYVYMNLRLFVFQWLADTVGVVGRLIIIPIGLLEVVAFISFFAGIVVFLLPSSAIATLNANREARNRRSIRKAAVEDDDDDIDLGSVFREKEIPFPVYVTDDEGNHYNVSKGGDYIYIDLPNGDRLSTKWEYVKGGPYFHLGGKRFYPHN